MKTIGLILGAVLGVLTAGCDEASFCMDAILIHNQRCIDGDAASCDWLEAHKPAPGAFPVCD